MMETPFTTHITADDYLHVYEPAEDTFLLIDAIESDLPQLQNRAPILCCEVGPGSGIVVTAIAKALPNTQCFGIDLNSYACRVAKKTAKFNVAKNVQIINGNLMGALRTGKMDILIFNPPYVVTEDEEINEKRSAADKLSPNLVNENIVKAWAGGADGRRIVDQFFLQMDNMLAIDGWAYVLVIKDNKPEQIIVDLGKIGFGANIIAERKIRGEHLYVLKIERLKKNK